LLYKSFHAFLLSAITFKNFIIFIYEIDKNKLKGIRIYQPQEGKPTRTIVAQKGELISIPEKSVIKLKLIQGTSDEPDPKDPAKLYKLNFKTYDLPLNIQGMRTPETLGKKPKDMSIKELRDEIDELGNAFSLFIGQSQDLRANLEKQVAERTRQLEEKMEQSEKMNEVMIGRELKMAELKKENERLKAH